MDTFLVGSSLSWQRYRHLTLWRRCRQTQQHNSSCTTRSSVGSETKPLEVDQIDHDALLFELGIDSMGAATIGSQLEALTDKTLNPDVLYELETINELAAHLDSLRPRDPLAVGSPSGANAAEASCLSCSVDPKTADAHTGLFHRYKQLNRRVWKLKDEGRYFFEPEISQHDGVGRGRWQADADARFL